MNVVPHTHWDREWYRTFQDLRLALVEVLDDLLDDLAGDPALTHFLLDGQAAAVDDYLELRPERGGRATGAPPRRAGSHGALVHAARRSPRLG